MLLVISVNKFLPTMNFVHITINYIVLNLISIFLYISFLQQRQYYYLGLFVAMSISQGGCGIPFLASTVYDYIATGKCTSVSQSVNPHEIPEHSLRSTVEKVSHCSYAFFL